MKALGTFVLLVCLHLAVGKLNWAGLNKSDKVKLRYEPVQHRPVTDIWRELKRRERRASGSPPVAHNYKFAGDNHRYGLIHYSGSDSKVSGAFASVVTSSLPCALNPNLLPLPSPSGDLCAHLQSQPAADYIII